MHTLLQSFVTDVTSDWTGNSLSSSEEYVMEIRRHARLVHLQCEQSIPRIDKLTRFLHQSIILVTKFLDIYIFSSNLFLFY